MSTSWRNKPLKTRSRLTEQNSLQVQHLECRRMLSGESVVENSPPTVDTPLYDVTVNAVAPPRLIDLEHLYAESDANDVVTISVDSNTNSGIVMATVNEKKLLLVFSGTTGTAQITLRGTDSHGESAMSAFNVNVKDGGSSIAARVASNSSVGSVGTISNELASPDILHEWEPAMLEVWYTVDSDTPDGPFDLELNVQALASFFETPTVHAALGSHISTQNTLINGWHSTFSTINNLDLSGYQIGDRVLIATYRYEPLPSGGIAMTQKGTFPGLSHNTLFRLTEGAFVGAGPVIIEPLVASEVAPVVFDANDDGRVGIADFAQFIRNYGTSNDSFLKTYRDVAFQFDYNRDGRVGIADFAYFIEVYGRQFGGNSDFEIPALTKSLGSSSPIVADSNVHIGIEDAVHQVFDPVNRILYIATRFGDLERWSYDNQTLLQPYEDVARSIREFDITPDGRFAYVGEASTLNSQGTVWKVDLTDGSKTALDFDREYGEYGVNSLAIASNGKAFFTANASSWSSVYEIDLSTDEIKSLKHIRRSTGITRGADRSLLFFQEGNNSSGPIFTYDANTAAFSPVKKSHRFAGNLPAAVGPKGEKIVFNNVLLSDELVGDIVGRQYGYAPTFDLSGKFIYSIDIEADEVLVSDARDLKLLRRISIGADVTSYINVAISDDSQHLFITTKMGIRQVATSIPGANHDDRQVPTGEVIRLFPDSSEFAPPWLTVQFDEPVTGLTLDEFRLTHDGGSNLLSGSESLSSIDKGQTWILFGAQSLMMTPGTYTLRVEAEGSGIQDLNGNFLSSDIYQVWTRLLGETYDIPVTLQGIRDQVYDESHGILYITTEEGSLQRWDVANRRLLPSIDDVAASPRGLDITEDGAYAYVGEGSGAISQGVVWKVDLNTGRKVPIRYAYDYSERGVGDLAISADGEVFFTTDIADVGKTPLRSINVATGSITTYFEVSQESRITRGADRSVLFFQEWSSDGPIFTYDAESQSLSPVVKTRQYVGALPAAVSRDGSQIAFLNSILNSSDLAFTSTGISNGVEYAFDPTRDILYVANDITDEIVAYDPITLGEIDRFDIGEDVSELVKMTIKEDARYVFLTTENGIRQIPIYVPEGDVVPPVAEFFAEIPSQRYDAINSATIQFNEVVNGITLDDFQLTRNGSENLLTGSETVTTTDGGLTWALDGIESLTDSIGNYQLQLIAGGSGIQDSAGNLLVWDASVNWKVISPELGGILLPLSNLREQVFDENTRILYLTTSEGHLQRWDTSSRKLLESFEDISENPQGLDITPDGQYAYIGEGTVRSNGGIVWKVDLSDGSKTALHYDLAFGEYGVYDLAIASNGKAYFTTLYGGSGWTPMHEIDLSNDEIKSLQNVQAETSIARSADRSLLLFLEGNTSAGPIFTYDADMDTFSNSLNTSELVGPLPAAVNRDGSLIAFINTVMNSSDFSSIEIGIKNAAGYVFDPTRNILFVADQETHEIVAYDPLTLTELNRYAIGEPIADLVEVTIDDSGHYAFVITDSGVRQIPLFEPLGDLTAPSGEFLRDAPQDRFHSTELLKIQFDEVVTEVTLDDFWLTYNDGENLLTGSETVTSFDGGVTWVIEGLEDLTGNLGDYRLELYASGSGIQDASGNLLMSDIAMAWKVISPDVGGVLLASLEVREHFYDESRGLLYLALSGGTLERWDVATHMRIDRFEGIAQNPSGFDISPDGAYAYIGEELSGPATGIVWKVDLRDGTKTAILYELDTQERGVSDLAISADGKVFFTTHFAGGGSNPLHVIDLATDQIMNLQEVGQRTTIARSADRTLLFFQEPHTSAGTIFTYDAETQEFLDDVRTNRILGIPDAVSRDGSMIAFLGSIWDASDLSVMTDGITDAAGYVFDPTRDILYVADHATNEIVALDPITLSEIVRHPIGEDISDRVEMSVNEDATVFFVQTESGVRQVGFSALAGDAVPPYATFADVLPVERHLKGESVQFDSAPNSSLARVQIPVASVAGSMAISSNSNILREFENGKVLNAPLAYANQDWQRQLVSAIEPSLLTVVDQHKYTCAVDDLFASAMNRSWNY